MRKVTTKVKTKSKSGKVEHKNLVKRFPIILNKHAVAVIHVFTRHDCIEDMWMSDCGHNNQRELQQQGAVQMIEQLEDEWTPAFLVALRDAITKILAEHDVEFGTLFAQQSTLRHNAKITGR
ncbi:MAG TPA: hypothetical protein ENN23_09945 [Deltaproteobacteria bacterium]|nr:hypothetical protein [Deltaproteobacteria bacterium]